MKRLVLSANTYNFENKQGEKVQGTKIAYTSLKSMNQNNHHGNPPLIVNLQGHILEDNILGKFPAICDLEFEEVPGKDNKPVQILTDLDILSEIDFETLF